MSEPVNRLNSLLASFGLTNNEAKIYIHLIKSKELSALTISRDLNISRTKVYAILDRLASLGLVSISGKKNVRRFYANSYKQLEILVNQKRSELEMLESSLPTIFEQLASIELGKSADSKIMNYKGVDGLKTVTWNSTRAKGILRIFEVAKDMAAFLDFDFSERARMEFLRKGLKSSRQITNFKKISPWTNISKFVDIWEARYIDPKKLQMNTEILIYNDTVTMYQLEKKVPFCVEIYNKELAIMMKNVFDFVWGFALKMKKLDKRGSAKV